MATKFVVSRLCLKNGDNIAHEFHSFESRHLELQSLRLKVRTATIRREHRCDVLGLVDDRTAQHCLRRIGVVDASANLRDRNIN